jgi:CO/xanthine dehydrogenase FAD-binding subunit
MAAEAALDGRPPTPQAADAAAEALAAAISPIDDVRSSADYRRVVAARTLHRIVRDVGGW